MKIYEHVIQSTEEWLQLRCGVLTASEMSRIITPAKLEMSQSGTARTHLNDIVAARS